MIAATGDDKVNVVVSLLAKTEFAVPRVVARANDPRNEWLFDEAWGVDVAVSTPRMLASLVEEAVAVGDLVHLMEFRTGQANLIEITLPADTPWGGKPLRKLQLPRDAALVTILRGLTGHRAGGRRAARGRRRAALRRRHRGRGRAARAAAASAEPLALTPSVRGRWRRPVVASRRGLRRDAAVVALVVADARPTKSAPPPRRAPRPHTRPAGIRAKSIDAADDHTREGDRDQSGDAGDRVVDRRADPALRRIHRGQNRRRQRRHRHRQPEPEHHQAGQQLCPEVERLVDASTSADNRPPRSAGRQPCRAAARACPPGCRTTARGRTTTPGSEAWRSRPRWPTGPPSPAGTTPPAACPATPRHRGTRWRDCRRRNCARRRCAAASSDSASCAPTTGTRSDRRPRPPDWSGPPDRTAQALLLDEGVHGTGQADRGEHARRRRRSFVCRVGPNSSCETAWWSGTA